MTPEHEPVKPLELMSPEDRAQLVERLRSGQIPDRVLPVLFGIVVDKKSLS